MNYEQELKKQIGWRAFNALKKGRVLCQWTNSVPHNWWVPCAPSSKYEFIWHSFERETPRNLHKLFVRVSLNELKSNPKIQYRDHFASNGFTGTKFYVLKELL